MKNLYFQALRKNYAVPAFNFYNLESFMAIKSAAFETKADVIFAVSESAMKYMGDDFLRFLCQKNYVHLDHGHSLESVKHAISLGFKSVMIDGSALPFTENVKLTKAVVKYAHAKDVWVEAEIGVLCGHEDDVHSSTQMFTDPIQAKKFVEMTGCDSLAVAVGTSHGAYKGVGKLRFDILSAIHKLMPKMPLVLHGASQIPQKYTKILGLKKAAGIPEADIKKAIKLGICKVNVDSDSRLAWTSVIKQLFSKKLETFDPRFFLGQATIEMKSLYMREIRFMAFSNNKRADSESM